MDEKEFESAEALTDMMRDDGLWRVHQACEPEKRGPDDPPSPYCVDCGNEIPPERLILGRIRCIGCQRVLEFKRKLGC